MQKFIARPTRLAPRVGRLFSASTSPEINFDDISIFQAKGKTQLVKSLAIQTICKVRPLVSNANAIIKFGRSITGDKFVDFALKHTFFNHFCGGVDIKEVEASMARLDKLGVGSILDFAAEYDVEDATCDAADPNAEFERNTNDLIASIDLAAKAARQAYIAVKITALVAPQTLIDASTLAHASRSFFLQHASGSADLSLASISQESFVTLAQAAGASAEEATALFAKLAASGKDASAMHFGEWFVTVTPKLLSENPLLASIVAPNVTVLTAEQISEMDLCQDRADRISQAGAKQNVRVLIDAEHVRVQTAIDLVALTSMLRFNSAEACPVFNTYQCYLRDANARLVLDMAALHRSGLQFGAKLVRGAYMRHERAEALTKNLPDPVCPSLEATHESYNSAVSRVLDEVQAKRANVLLGTHNERSVQLAVEGMRQRGILPSSERVAFGQLLGMCDNVTMKMGALGFSSYKYVPYGPVKLVLPYLLRRAEENSDMLGSGGKEMRMVWSALKK